MKFLVLGGESVFLGGGSSNFIFMVVGNCSELNLPEIPPHSASRSSQGVLYRVGLEFTESHVSLQKLWGPMALSHMGLSEAINKGLKIHQKMANLGKQPTKEAIEKRGFSTWTQSCCAGEHLAQKTCGNSASSMDHAPLAQRKGEEVRCQSLNEKRARALKTVIVL